MKTITILTFLGFMLLTIISFEQKTISEGTIVYEISLQSRNNEIKLDEGFAGATSTRYLKGGLSRTDMKTTVGTETTIYNSKTGNAAILKEYSGQKLMVLLTKANWEEKNKNFEGLVFENSSETKLIGGYHCKKAITKLKDGSSLSVYYTPDLVAINKEYDRAFSNLPGFPLEYELETARLFFKYKLSSIDFNTVPALKFEYPQTGFRVMTYEETKKGNGGQ
jgi:GLPGLI family protein